MTFRMLLLNVGIAAGVPGLVGAFFAPPYPVQEAFFSFLICLGSFVIPLFPRIIARQKPKGELAVLGLAGNVFRMFFVIVALFWVFTLDFINPSVFFPATLTGYFTLLGTEVLHLHFSALNDYGQE